MEPKLNVALIIDFENLVYGLNGHSSSEEESSEEDYKEILRLDRVFHHAAKYGRVIVTRAYADWQRYAVNKYQRELYGYGAELVHVLGTKHKNAVDVKLSIDTVELAYTNPLIDVFVIVSGDRDFIHLVKALRARGKRVVGLGSKTSSVSPDLRAMCDEYDCYHSISDMNESMSSFEAQSSLSSVQHMPETTSSVQADDSVLDLVRIKMKAILSKEKGGVVGARLKVLIQKELGCKFEHDKYGYPKFKDFLEANEDMVELTRKGWGRDITVSLRS